MASKLYKHWKSRQQKLQNYSTLEKPDRTFHPVRGIDKVKKPCDKLYKVWHDRYLPMVTRLARKLDSNNQQDLIQYGRLAIYQAVANYGEKCHHGLIFAAINRAMRKASFIEEQQTRMLPDYDTIKKYRKGIKRYKAKHHEDPTAEQLAKFMNIRVTLVRDYYLRTNYQSVTETEIIDRDYRADSSHWYERQQAYEDNLIYFIDRRWLKQLLPRLPLQYRRACLGFMSNLSVDQWSTRHNISSWSGYDHQNKLLTVCRELAELRFDLNSPVDPLEYLKRKRRKPSE